MKSYWFLDHAWLVPLIPALSFAIILLIGKRFGPRAAWIGITSVGASFVLAVGSVIQWIQHVGDSTNASGARAALGSAFGGIAVAAEGKTTDAKFVAPIVHTTTWLQTGSTKLHVGIQIDGLSVLLMFVVTTVSLLVHVYCTEYLHGDRRFNHYFAALSLFTASMLLLVVSSSTLELLMGWELVGVCSFMLIGHWWEEEANTNAALKAFFTTRTGDIGLLTGVIMTFFVVQRATGTVRSTSRRQRFGHEARRRASAHTLLLLCALALLLAVMGKSGQFPLHTWLPDAMAGPTPVSALIHAATMVVAGVYLGARVYPIFYQGFHIAKGPFNIMAIVGGITVIIGAALAFVQDDIKKVLAYSTISQLGYMVMALGVGAWTAAVFHLFTHAFFKADLFLGAGSVSHSGAHHSFDMKKDMGGLAQVHAQHLHHVRHRHSGAHRHLRSPQASAPRTRSSPVAGANGFTFFKVVGLVGAVMTAAYMTRCVYLTFFGEYRGGHASPAAHGHDEHAQRRTSRTTRS